MARPQITFPNPGEFAITLGHLTAAGTFDFVAGGESSITIESAVVSPPSHPEVVLLSAADPGDDIQITGVNITHILDHLL
jgi:hypothetical protein